MKLKYILALGLTAGALLSWTPAQAVHAAVDTPVVFAQATNPAITGTSDSVSWTLSNGTLTICSSTASPVSLPDYAPWIIASSNYIDKENVNNVIINADINSIGERVFIGYPNLSTVTVNGALSKIGASAFENCPKLSNITFSGSVGSIGTQAFNKCASLQSIIFPKGVGSIDKSAFEDCSSLENITVQKGSTTIGTQAFLNCNSLSKVSISNGASGIGEFAFKNCTKLSAITISNSATTIGKGAFLGCSSLTSITLPNNLTAISESTFDGCSALGSITIPSKVTSIGKQAFLNCESLKRIDIPVNVKSIGESAFTGCTGLNLVSIPKETTNIVSPAFNGCTSLSAIQYSGTEAAWKKLNLDGPQIKELENKHRIFYATQPSTPAETHKWSDWTTVSTATVFKGAVQKRTCSICGKSETKTGSKLKPTIRVNVSSFPLKVGQKTTALKVNGFAKGDSVASWKSSNTKIARVSGSANGSNKITAGKKTGKATITITLKSGLKKNISVTVQKKAVAAKKITGVPKTLKLKVKKKASLKPVLNPITCVDKVTYKTSNKKIATVNGKGQISAKKKGKAVITVKTGKKTVKCTVTVK